MKVYIVQKEEWAGLKLIIGVYATAELAEIAKAAVGATTHTPVTVMEFDVQGSIPKTFIVSPGTGVLK